MRRAVTSAGQADHLSPFAIVTLIDSSAPVIGAVANVDAEATSASGAIVEFALPAVHDNLDPHPAVVAEPASGTSFPIGSTTVRVTATHKSGNASTASFGRVGR